LIGVVSAGAVRHAYVHFRPAPEKLPPPSLAPLSPAIKAQLVAKAQTKFLEALDHSAAGLQHDLDGTSAQLGKLLEKFGTEIVSDEMNLFRSRLDELRTQTEDAIKGAQSEMTTHQAEVEAELVAQKAEMVAKLTEEIAAKKQQLVTQIDTKLADAVMSFLVETLKHNIDLGTQGPYLVALLDEHKDDFKREVDDGAPATK